MDAPLVLYASVGPVCALTCCCLLDMVSRSNNYGTSEVVLQTTDSLEQLAGKTQDHKQGQGAVGQHSS